ncbi:NAD(P)/FAD-dependent oxidoreductase [Hydrogenophaga intermedia]|jgi:predicted Rossmann fold flavoprotein|uniref:NAD(P)/FAD-dependent oxidoreductase n=1 Tax=Hydrogenophaga intermedia TaxID=65786 RepID=UPI0020430BF5|nr:NAD(P)/FAD-dependent oxidoreductase [Hydrogenophaga intermedia]MCM3562217.1 NAD(P)/FAD-dependent oxidoreductase [Hydrogenophaga intermedia]
MTDTAWDVIVVGAGAAGLFCAGIAGQRGRRVLLIDHSAKVAEKIRISGGGRANFTNRDLDPRAPQKHFVGENPNFCRSALSRYTPADFIALVDRHGIAWHEKHKGQLFCDRSADDLIQVLLRECEAGGVTRWQPCAVAGVRQGGDGAYELDTDRGPVRAPKLVVATGGLPIPQIGASDFGLRLAAQFGLRVVDPRPALVPLTFDGAGWAPYAELAGLALPVRIETGEKKARMAFDEDLLFTHRGLSGPAVLQISSYWLPGTPLRVDLAPGAALADALAEAKRHSHKRLANELARWVPSRLADAWTARDADWQRPVMETADKALARLAGQLQRWELVPTGTEGWRKAEVMRGGVDTRELSQQTLESRQPGLYFIGEVVDVTGWLGGYNFQWAWASAHACAQAI